MKRTWNRVLALALVGLAACAAPSEHRKRSKNVLAGWQGEHIVLPPDFAPSLPAGDEHLLFAPGMFDAAAEDFWSYAFVLWIDDDIEWSQARLRDVLEAYYDGLVNAVAQARSLTVDGEPAQVTVRATGDSAFEADLSLFEPFVTGERIDLRVVANVLESNPAGSTLVVRASPQPKAHPVWQELSSALEQLIERGR